MNAKFSGQTQGGYTSDDAIVDWWRKFNDSQLNKLVSRALANNLDLQDRRRARRRGQGPPQFRQARLLPHRAPPARVTRTSSTASPRPTDGFGPRSVEIYSAGFEATWELDIWGRVRHTNKAAVADVATAEAVRHDTMVILTSEVARSYVELRGLQNQLSVAQRNAENQRETLKLTESLLQGGRGTELDTSRARAQLNTTLAVIPSIEAAISRNIHRISVLIGEQPTVLQGQLATAKPMPTLPGPVRIGDPAGLLRRRPDVEAAEKALEAATERVGVAVAGLFPTVTFNGTAAIQANQLSGPGSAATAFGPSISWPAFDLGRVQAQIDAARRARQGPARQLSEDRAHRTGGNRGCPRGLWPPARPARLPRRSRQKPPSKPRSSPASATRTASPTSSPCSTPSAPCSSPRANWPPAKPSPPPHWSLSTRRWAAAGRVGKGGRAPHRTCPLS